MTVHNEEVGAKKAQDAQVYNSYGSTHMPGDEARQRANLCK